jgi:uncharacterized membrane protein
MGYRIIIGNRREDSESRQPPKGRGKLQILKAGILTFLALSVVVGIFLAAFVVGSIIASVLLVLVAVAIIAAPIRGLYLKFRDQKTNSLSPKK